MDAFHEAVEFRDALTVDAFRNAPRFLDMLPPGVQERGLQTYAEKRDPERARDLGAAERALSQLETLIHNVERTIVEDAGLPELDPIRAMAEGGELA